MASSPVALPSPELEPHGPGPFLDATGQWMHSMAANLRSRFPHPFNCMRDGSSVFGSSGLVCGPSSSRCSSGASASVSVPVLFPFCSPFSSENRRRDLSSASSAVRNLSTSVRVDGLGLGSKAGGPAFVGQVFSMCDPSGTGLMAVTTHFGIPFLSKRTPEWIKKMFAVFTEKDNPGPVFRFFMDLGDAVSYVKKLNIPTGMVGACRLDVAYEHFKEKPNMFQFVPNKKQVKAANKLLEDTPQKRGKRKVDGVPVFTAQNLNIAIATSNGIKWYTPYFFDKRLLDNILEASVDQHFHALIRNRHLQRRRDVLDDNVGAEVFDDNGESLFDPPEVQELLDEMGPPGIPLSVVSKTAEIQFLDVVDKVLLGNKWLRKATGIQPKFPYVVDSFEERSAASFLKVTESASSAGNSECGDDRQPDTQLCASECALSKCAQSSQNDQKLNNRFHFPMSSWFSNPWSRLSGKEGRPDDHMDSDKRVSKLDGELVSKKPNPLLPKITMVGISTSEGGQVSKASLKKTMEELTRELEQSNQGVSKLNEDKDPLFVANVGDYSTITRMSSR
uniref:Alpha-mannosidase 2 n=1 Tax=Anthurium amnicola TaxID=1678845 RepID=A0A1D1XT87_9ARAE